MQNESLQNRLVEAFIAPRETPFSRFLGMVVTGSLYAAVILVPLFFLTSTLDVLELNKQTLLIILTMVAFVTFLGKSINEKKLSLNTDWMQIVVALFGVGYFIVSFFSSDRYLSLVGNFGQMQWAFVSIAAFILLYVLIVNTVKTTSHLYAYILVFLGSSSVVALFGILQACGIFTLSYFSPLSATSSFNTIGTFNALAMYITTPFLIAVSLVVLGCKDTACVLGRRGGASIGAKILVWVTIGLSATLLVVVDYTMSLYAVCLGAVLVVGITCLRTMNIGHPTKILVPIAVFFGSVFLLFTSNPIISLPIPGEISPSLSHSWLIAKQTLQSHPVLGSGPGTWIFDYAKYKLGSVNSVSFWQQRFDHAYNSFLTLFATVGLVGISLWLLLIATGIGKSIQHLVREKNDDVWQAYLTVFVGWMMTIFTAFLYNYNFSHHFVFWFLLALLSALVSKKEIHIGAKNQFVSQMLIPIVLVIFSVLAICVTWISAQRYIADSKFSSSVMSFRSGKNIQESIDSLQSAVMLNPYNDAYFRNVSQAYLIRLGFELQGGQKSEKVELVNSLLKQALDNAKRATDLSPANVDNWSNIAIIYQSITSFIRGADDFAIQYYIEAIKREPNNPTFYTELGKLYVLRSDAYRTLLSSADSKVRADAEIQVKAELEKAASYLNQAIQVKSDFALAHYNLGIVYERQGRIKDAILILEKVLNINNKDLGTAFQLAILYYRDGQKDKAINLFEQIVNMDGSYANARWYLSSIYEERGRLADALAQVLKIQEANQDNSLVLKRVQDLTAKREAKNKPAAVSPSTNVLQEPLVESLSSLNALNAIKKK